jgi:hypothetical protein
LKVSEKDETAAPQSFSSTTGKYDQPSFAVAVDEIRKSEIHVNDFEVEGDVIVGVERHLAPELR